MQYDIVTVLYNSAKWLPGYFAALAGAGYNLAQLNLVLVDNASTDETLEVAEQLRLQYKGFGGFTLLPQGGNGGFAKGCNAGAAAGNAPFVFFLNADTEVMLGLFAALDTAIERADANAVAFECRQIPYEHPKYYNPVTGQTSWASGAALVVRRAAFALAGGFDEDFFMYCEDVDLSWRLQLAGGALQYVPSAVVRHFAYSSSGAQKPRQLAGHLAGDLALRHKFGTKDDIAAWQNWADVAKRELDAEAQDFLQRELEQVRAKKGKRRRFWRQQVKHSGFAPCFMDGDYSYMRTGAFAKVQPVQSGPLFSVLVRTHSRPALLGQTLQSLAAQTYRNFEVVVVEDGEATAQEMLKDGFAGLDIKYHATLRPVGRCGAGNLAMQMAKGEFFNFLDDDDYFFADHLEHMAQLAGQNPGAKLLAAASLEAVCRYPNDDLCNWQIAGVRKTHYTGVSFAQQAYGNCFAIQEVAFHRSLFEQMGGLDEELDALEDWDLWTRYMQTEPVAYSPKATSLFKTPANPLQAAQRFLKVQSYAPQVRKKFAGYARKVTAAEISDVARQETGDEYQSLCQQAEDWVQAAHAIYASTSWKLAAPLRALQKALVPRRLRGNREYAANILFCNPNEFTLLGQYRQFVTYANASLGWRITAPLRGRQGR